MNDRIHYLDSMRSVLMMLGVVLHAAQIFNPAGPWYVVAERPSALSGHLAELIHLFRMPAFFVISGFFCALTLDRYGPRRFVAVRMQRIAVPLVATALTLGPLQAWLLAATGRRAFDPLEWATTGQWVSHLWFLLVLLVYFAGAAALAALAPGPVAALGRLAGSLMRRVPMPALIVALALAQVVVIGSYKLGYPLYDYVLANSLSVYQLSVHLPYFVLGAVLFVDRALLARFASVHPLASVGIAAAALALLALEPRLPEPLRYPWETWTKGVAALALVALCFRAFRAFADRPSPTWRFLSDASYTVYLFHHVTVMALGALLVDRMPALVALALIIALTLAITLAVHRWAILPSPTLGYLYNGKTGTPLPERAGVPRRAPT